MSILWNELTSLFQTITKTLTFPPRPTNHSYHPPTNRASSHHHQRSRRYQHRRQPYGSKEYELVSNDDGHLFIDEKLPGKRRRETVRRVQAQVRVSEVAYRRIQAARRLLKSRQLQQNGDSAGSSSIVGADGGDGDVGGHEGLYGGNGEAKLALKDVEEGSSDLKGCIVALVECLEEEMERRQQLERILMRERKIGGRLARKDHTMPVGVRWGERGERVSQRDERKDRKKVRYVPRANTWTVGTRSRRGDGSVNLARKGQSRISGDARMQRRKIGGYDRQSTSDTDGEEVVKIFGNRGRPSRSMGSVTFSSIVTTLGQENVPRLRHQPLSPLLEIDEEQSSNTPPGGSVGSSGGGGTPRDGRKLRSSLRQAGARPSDMAVHWDLPARA